MSEHTGSSSSGKKFPYLVIPNASPPFDKIDRVYSSRGRDKQSKRETDLRNNAKADQQQGAPFPGSNYLSLMEEHFQSQANLISHSAGHVPLNEFNPPLNSISMSQMKAILTAQKELRKPAGSLYPSASLIPETELIYKKYFPNEGIESKLEKMANKCKVSETEKPTTWPSKSPNISYSSDPDSKKAAVSASISVSESSITTFERSKKSDCQNSPLEGECIASRGIPEISKMSSDKQGVLKQRDAEARFRKRVQTQLVSLCAEVERQSLELNEIKREFKELLHMSRQNATDIDSSKSRLDTLSKHVHEIDNKMDTIQENVSGQEKNLLSKLMLIGEMSDSDSDLDDCAAMKGIDALSCPSATKLAVLSNIKRPLSSGSVSDSLPKSCCNWVPIAPDFDKLVQAVALINYRMDRNQSMKLCTTNNGATFKHSDVIDLTIFKNGIILGSTGFRSYSTMSVIRFVNEIFNGYLPTELSTQYPDGVVVVLTDKRSVIHSCDENFNGSGTRLSGTDPPDLLPGTSMNILQKKDSRESLKASTTASLASISESASIASASTISSYEMLPDLIMGHSETDGVKVNQKIITLKINDRKNGHRYKVKVPVRATIGAVTDHLSSVLTEKEDVSRNTVACSTAFKSYDLILPVPHGKLSCTGSTLEEYGITQNTLIYIQEQKS